MCIMNIQVVSLLCLLGLALPLEVHRIHRSIRRPQFLIESHSVQPPIRTELVQLSGVFNEQYHRTVRMLDLERQRSQHFLVADTNHTLHGVAAFGGRLQAGLDRAAALVQHVANGTCTVELANERIELWRNALHAERACLRTSTKQLQRTLRSTFYQLARLMARESMGTKSLVLAVLGQYNVCGERERALIAPTLHWTAEWTADMWPSSADNLRAERERTVQQTMRAESAMRLCERQVDEEFEGRIKANVRLALQC